MVTMKKQTVNDLLDRFNEYQDDATVQQGAWSSYVHVPFGTEGAHIEITALDKNYHPVALPHLLKDAPTWKIDVVDADGASVRTTHFSSQWPDAVNGIHDKALRLARILLDEDDQS